MQACAAARSDPFESPCLMSHPLLKSCLDALSRTGSGEAAWSVVQGHRRKLLSNPEIGAELAAIVAAAREAKDIPAELMVLEALIEQARMDRENAGTHGAAFLSALDDAIARLVGKGEITGAGTFLLGGCYIRAGLAAPGHLRRSGAAEERDYSAMPGDLPDLDELLEALPGGRDLVGLQARAGPQTMQPRALLLERPKQLVPVEK